MAGKRFSDEQLQRSGLWETYSPQNIMKIFSWERGLMVCKARNAAEIARRNGVNDSTLRQTVTS